jgi:hypothetical protein
VIVTDIDDLVFQSGRTQITSGLPSGITAVTYNWQRVGRVIMGTAVVVAGGFITNTKKIPLPIVSSITNISTISGTATVIDNALNEFVAYILPDLSSPIGFLINGSYTNGKTAYVQYSYVI